jgi:hypothetical protein
MQWAGTPGLGEGAGQAAMGVWGALGCFRGVWEYDGGEGEGEGGLEGGPRWGCCLLGRGVWGAFLEAPRLGVVGVS